MTASDHSRLVGIFLLAHGILNTVTTGILIVVLGLLGTGMFLSPMEPEQEFAGLVIIITTIALVGLLLIFFLPQVIGGWKLYKGKSAGRTWGIFGSATALLSFPLGTASGVYGLWFLLSDDGKSMG